VTVREILNLSLETVLHTWPLVVTSFPEDFSIHKYRGPVETFLSMLYHTYDNGTTLGIQPISTEAYENVQHISDTIQEQAAVRTYPNPLFKIVKKPGDDKPKEYPITGAQRLKVIARAGEALRSFLTDVSVFFNEKKVEMPDEHKKRYRRAIDVLQRDDILQVVVCMILDHRLNPLKELNIAAHPNLGVDAPWGRLAVDVHLDLVNWVVNEPNLPIHWHACARLCKTLYNTNTELEDDDLRWLRLDGSPEVCI
jgi:hypothetical protein